MKTIYIAENTGTGAAPYAIVHKDAMGATAYVPKKKLNRAKRKNARLEAEIAAIRRAAEETKT